MTVQYIAGFETGDGSELVVAGANAILSSPTISGGYALQLTSVAGAFTYVQTKAGFNLSTCYFRCRINAHLTTTPTIEGDFTLVSLDNIAAAQVVRFGMIVTTGGVFKLYCRTGSTFSNVYSGPTETIISADTTYLVEIKVVISSTVGILEWKLNGVVMGTLTSANTGSSNIDTQYIAVGGAGNGTYNVYFDDISVDNANYPGPGRCIKVQGTTGTPNVDAFTKTGAATAALCWSTTPYGTVANCNSSTSGAGQTMLCAASGLTIQQINACKAAMIAKTAVASSHSIRRRLASTNTDLAKSLTTADAYYESAIFTDTIANLNTAEIGMLHGANTNLTTVEDMWLMIDYTDVSLIVEPIMQAVMQSANW